MKKKFLSIACCATLLSITSIAYSATGPYVSGNLGIAMASDSDWSNPALDSILPGTRMTLKSDSGLAFSGAIGGGLSNNVRLEAEVAYQKNDLDRANVSIPRVGSATVGMGGDTSSTALLVNGYFDFVNSSAFTPFIGAGLGFANVGVSPSFTYSGYGTTSGSADETVFAYQLGAGVNYAINEKISFDVKYRYFRTSDPEFNTTTIEYSSHNIYAGIRVGF